MTSEDIAHLVIKIQKGDESAFDQLFYEYSVKAMRTAAFITGDVSLAEDITQETFIKCLQNINSLKTPESFKQWFFLILTRCAWSALNKKKRITPVEEIYEKAESLLPPVFDSYSIENQCKYELLYTAINMLNKKQRTTIILYYFNNLSIKEIAQATGSLEATVKSRLHLAKKYLKNSLIKHALEGEPVYEK